VKRVLSILTVVSLVLFASVSVFGAVPQKVAYIVENALGDQAYYDSGQDGIDRIKEAYGIRTTTIECNLDAARYPQAMQSAVQWGAEVVFLFSYESEDILKQYADMYPDVIWVNLDTVVKNNAGNITSIVFVEEEAAFMAGVTAALMTTRTDIPGINPAKIVGVVGGDDHPIIHGFIFGYENGAHYVDPEVEVKSVLTFSFADPVRGKQAANQLFAQGADVVFQVAGLTGAGVLEAAKEQGKYAIGVDSNQNHIQPGHVVTSALKNFGNVVFSTFEDIVNGTFVPGETKVYGLKEGGVGLAIDEYTEEILPAEIIEEIRAIEDKIRAGELTIERYPGRVQN